MDQRCDAVTMVMREGFSVTAITARLKLRVHHDDVITQLATKMKVTIRPANDSW